MPVSSHPVWGAWIEIGKLSIRSEATFSSHPVWGAWIEMLTLKAEHTSFTGRTPCGCVD